MYAWSASLLDLLRRAPRPTLRRGNRSGRSQTPRARVLRFEPLEERVLLSTTLFLDFGAAVGMGGMIDTTPAAYRDIFGAGTGTDITDNGAGSPADADTLRLRPLQYDFDMDGSIATADLTALANAVLPLAQRALEPFDIDIVIGAATSLADAVTAVAANAGDAAGEFDAYVFVMQATSDFGGSTFSNAVSATLYGEAAGNDLTLQMGNTQDEAALTFADNVLNSVGGTSGTAVFNADLVQRLAYTSVHEAFHTFSYRHTSGLIASGDVIRLGSVTRDDPFMVTRYDLTHDIAVTEANNYLLAANDADIGLRDADGNGTPDLAYVTGTGANDTIGLSNAGGGVVNVAVNPFNDQARSSAIGAGESYTVDLSTDTDGEILLDAGVNADAVQLDATIATDFRLRGGEGADGSVSASADQDLLTLQSGGLSGTYTPGGDAESGSVSYAGGAAIEYSEFEDVEANGIPVVVESLVLGSAVLDEGDVLDLSGSFVNIDTLDSHTVTIAWGDGAADTVLMLAAGVREFAASHTYRDDNPSGTASDVYAVSVTVDDQDDGTGSAMANVTVNNVAPEITAIDFSEAQIDEGDVVTVTGTFVDPALGVITESFDGSALWSDGVATALAVNPDGTFSTSRLFLDDHPSTGTPSDAFTVSITIHDDDLGTDTAQSSTLIVNNLDPVIQSFESDATFDDKGQEGEPVTVTGSFTDIGVLDTHVAEVDWGDGTVEPIALVQGAGFGTVSGSHAYAAGGIYTVMLTVTDDDTGSHQSDTLAVITGVGLNDGVLYAIGSAEDDHVHIHQVGGDTIRVHASFIPEPFRDFSAAEVEQILSYLCQGDDHLTIAGNVAAPAIVHGDAGDDHLHGGGGAAVLLGGSGDDMLLGQSGRDILIGGTGRDRLVGGAGGDLLIGGTTTYDHNQDDALMNVLAQWTDPLATYEDRANAVGALLTVIDDGEADKLTGAAGRDLFYAGTGDNANDQMADEADGDALPLMAMMAAAAAQAEDSAPAIDWSAGGWGAGSQSGAAHAGAWTSEFLVAAPQAKPGRGPDSRRSG
jgi:hypothetical protein